MAGRSPARPPLVGAGCQLLVVLIMPVVPVVPVEQIVLVVLVVLVEQGAT
jgi:hypothetical protein